MASLRGLSTPWKSPHHLRMLGGFLLISFVAIFVTAFTLSTALSRYVVGQMMLRDAIVSAEFLNSIVHVEDAAGYFLAAPKPERLPNIEEFLFHVSRMPGVFRANVYGVSGEILWSSDAELIGRRFPDNPELNAALAGHLDPEMRLVSSDEKEEHAGFPEHVREFIECYIPIWTEDGSRVAGAVEVYKIPGSLLPTMQRVRTLTWLGALAAGTVLFAGLAWVVAYATRVLQRQEARLVKAERLAVVGEMASAVAHALRNPLAAIRSCAELTLEDDIPEPSRSAVHDITDQVDRLESWIRSFLIRGCGNAAPGEPSQIDQVVWRCLENFRAQIGARGIRVTVGRNDGPAVALTQAFDVEQVLNSILSNSIEAMPGGGRIDISWSVRADAMVEIHVVDSGPGIPPEMLDRLFTPFETGKSSGLGIGLSLSRRIAERLGGTLDMANGASLGVEVTLTVPAQG